jgi:Fe-S-cluster-containing dehydrogenase component
MKIAAILVNVTKCRGCRSCQLACSYVRHGVFNPDKSVIVLERDIETQHTAPMIQPIGCDLCGGDPACVKACPYEALVAAPEALKYKFLVQA